MFRLSGTWNLNYQKVSWKNLQSANIAIEFNSEIVLDWGQAEIWILTPSSTSWLLLDNLFTFFPILFFFPFEKWS